MSLNKVYNSQCKDCSKVSAVRDLRQRDHDRSACAFTALGSCSNWLRSSPFRCEAVVVVPGPAV